MGQPLTILLVSVFIGGHLPVKLCPPVKLNFNSKNKWVKVWVTEGAHAKIMYQTLN